MDLDKVKAEKAKALRRYNRIGRFFRAAEVCVAILFIFWTFARLPFAVQISGEFLRRIAGVISTHLFVFLFGNCIVLVLLTKSSHQTAVANVEPEIYQALVRSVPKPSDQEEIVYEDKEVILTDSNPNIPPRDGNDTVMRIYCSNKVYGRSKSDVVSDDSSMMMLIPKPSSSSSSSSSLQRSETEKCMRISDEDNNKMNYPEDKLSNEEFQKTIEDFIAKQSMFRRQESFLHNKSLIS